jgi:hypothetical protein
MNILEMDELKFTDKKWNKKGLSTKPF